MAGESHPDGATSAGEGVFAATAGDRESNLPGEGEGTCRCKTLPVSFQLLYKRGLDEWMCMIVGCFVEENGETKPVEI